MSWIVGLFNERRPASGTTHCLAHGGFHLLMIVCFAVNYATDRILAFSDDQINDHLSRLTKPPAPAHCLIIFFVTVRSAHKRHASAVAPIHSKSADRRFRYQPQFLAGSEGLQPFLF